MIEVYETLEVGAEDFFNSIAESIAHDISKSMGTKFHPKHIKKGYQYTKLMQHKGKHKGEVVVTIMEWNPPHIYRAEFQSQAGLNILSYHTKSLADGCIQVHYIEDFEGVSKSKNFNFRVVSFFYKGKARKRAIHLLHSIESYIQKTKRNESSNKEVKIL